MAEPDLISLQVLLFLVVYKYLRPKGLKLCVQKPYNYTLEEHVATFKVPILRQMYKLLTKIVIILRHMEKLLT